LSSALDRDSELTQFRPISPTEAVYIRARTQVVSHSAALGPITQPQFQTALAALEAHYPILRAALEGDHFVERAASPASLFIWLDRATNDLETLYQEALHRQLDLTAALYTVHVLADAAGFDILMLSSHAIADATALVAIHSSLLHFCDCAVRHILPPAQPQPFPESIDPTVEHCLAALPIPRLPAALPNPDAAFIRLPHLAEPSAPRYRNEHLVIEADSVPQIFATCRSHDVTLHSLLTAAFIFAIRAIAQEPGDKILLRHTVDMRRRLEPHISCDLIFTAVTGHFTTIENIEQSIFEIARMTQTDIRGATADGRILQEYLNYPQSFGTPQTAPIAINLSDMGVVAFHDEIAVLKPLGFDYATAIGQLFPNCSITIYGNRLVANTVYREDLITPATMRALSNHVIEILHQSCVTP
jgi:hypothetical protein